MNRGFLALSMTNSVQGAERGYEIIESIIQKQSRDEKGDKTILQLELSSEISHTLIEKGFISSRESGRGIEITPKGKKLISIIENLHELLQT